MNVIEDLFIQFSNDKAFFEELFLQSLPEDQAIDFLYIVGLFDLKYLEQFIDFLIQNPQIKVFIIEEMPIRFDQEGFFKLKEKLQDYPNFEWIISPEGFDAYLDKLPVNYLNPKIAYCFGKKLESDRYKQWIKIFEQIKRINHERSLFIIEMMGQDLLFKNFYEQSKHLDQQFSIQLSKGVLEGIPAIICGGGFSLHEQAKLLKEAENKAVIFAAGSAIKTLVKQAVEPNFLVATCPRPTQKNSISENIFFTTPVILTPRLNADAYYYFHGFGGVALSKGLEFDEILSSILNWPVENNHEKSRSLTVIALALRQAIHLGCNPIFLCGVDLNDVSNTQTEDKIFEWNQEQIWLEDFALEKNEKQIFTSSRIGQQFIHIPFINLEEGIERFCVREYDLEGIIESIAKPTVEKQKQERVLQYFRDIEKSFIRVQDSVNLLNEYVQQDLKIYDFRVLDLLEKIENETSYQKYLKPVIDCLMGLEKKVQSPIQSEVEERRNFHEQLKLFSAIVPRYLKIFKESYLC